AALTLMVGLRAVPHAVHDAMSWARLRRHGGEKATRSLLLYGADYRCKLFLLERSYRQTDRQEPVHIVGLLDDDSNLHSRYVHGHTVLGGIERTAELIAEHGIDEIVITDRLDSHTLAELERIARETGIRLSEWRTSWSPYTRVQS
ncbi:MAG: hypothetical protein O3A51_06045, partial [Verrucomicrobia bacterium]|nr:hypothetical protein [Verrucomicrobiota bacterium]